MNEHCDIHDFAHECPVSIQSVYASLWVWGIVMKVNVSFSRQVGKWGESNGIMKVGAGQE